MPSRDAEIFYRVSWVVNPQNPILLSTALSQIPCVILGPFSSSQKASVTVGVFWWGSCGNL